LPFHSGGTWPGWATVALFAALAVFGVGWTIWSADVLRAIAARYRLSEALGWHYLAGRSEPELPPIVIISTVSCIGVLAGLVAAVVILGLIAAERLGGGAASDALLMKNLTFYFGHMLVNITMYFGVAMVYEIMPAYTPKTCGGPRPTWTSRTGRTGSSVSQRLQISAARHEPRASGSPGTPGGSSSITRRCSWPSAKDASSAYSSEARSRPRDLPRCSRRRAGSSSRAIPCRGTCGSGASTTIR